MTELETKDEAEIESEDFADELSDEALDREALCFPSSGGGMSRLTVSCYPNFPAAKDR